MANVFNIAEVIDMGIAKEKKRRDFYDMVSKKFRDKEMKDLFTNLADWEEAHIKKFIEIRKSVEALEITESYQGEFEAYIKALVDDMLYRQVSAKWFGENVRSPLVAINYGMGFERDAILFFNELLKYMEPPDKDKVQLLIDEERKHLIYLAELKKKY